MRAFLIGLVIGILGFVVSLFLKEPGLAENGLLILGLGAMGLAAVFGGALSSGDRGRANYSDEQDFKQRMNWSTQLFLFGLPCVLASLAIYLLNMK